MPVGRKAKPSFPLRSLHCRSCSSFNMKMLNSTVKTAGTTASMLVCLATAKLVFLRLLLGILISSLQPLLLVFVTKNKLIGDGVQKQNHFLFDLGKMDNQDLRIDILGSQLLCKVAFLFKTNKINK